MNYYRALAIYKSEAQRLRRSAVQTVAAPILSAVIYFLVFGAAVGARVGVVDGVPYRAFIVPGLMMFLLLTDAIISSATGIFLRKLQNTLYEILSAPASAFEILLGFIGVTITKSLILALLIVVSAKLIIDFDIAHPIWLIFFTLFVAATFNLLGFIIGIWASDFAELQIIPQLIIMPLTFLGGAFYSVKMLPSDWQTIMLLNPIYYLVSGLRWTFYSIEEVPFFQCFLVIAAFFIICSILVYLIFRTGYHLKE